MRDGLGGVKSVAIVGGTSEIGLAIARALTTLGASQFVLAGRDTKAIQAAAADLPSSKAVKLDVDDVERHSEAVDTIFAGQDVDIAVLAVGVLHNDPDAHQISEMARVNGAGSISILAELASRLQSQGHGHLVVISTIAAVRPRPSNYWYGASKTGLDFAARGLSRDLDGTGIRVTVVRPGFVHTRMTSDLDPAPFACEPEDVGQSVAEAVRDGVGGVLWVPTALKWVSMVLQWLPHRILARLDR